MCSLLFIIILRYVVFVTNMERYMLSVKTFLKDYIIYLDYFYVNNINGAVCLLLV
jgi:hypothetical protein